MDLIERDEPLQELLKTQAAVATGSGRTVLVSGEAGIGKTSLVDHFLQIQPTGWRILWGACDDLFTPRPFGPIHDIASQAKGELPRLLQGDIDRFAIFSACLNELQTPTIFILEDIHWADEATIDLLKYLGRRIQHTCSLLVATYRDDELRSTHPLRQLLGDLVTNSATRRLVLRPLSVAGVHQLAGASRLDGLTLHQQTGGNPFFLTEVLATDGDDIPPTIRDAVLARVARLSLSGRAALNAMAVIGPRVEAWLLADVVQAEANAVDESLALGILTAQGKTLVFRHELARQTILETISPPQRLFLHQAVLDVLKVMSTTQQDVTRLAHHAAAANDREAILAYAPIAAQEAIALGMHRAAATLHALMLAYADDLPLPEQIALQAAYAQSMQSEPSKTATIAAYRQAITLSRQAGLPHLEGLYLAQAASALETVGEIIESEQLLAQALTILEPLAAHAELIPAYTTQARKHLRRGEHEAALTFAQKGYELALNIEDRAEIIKANHILGLCWLSFDHAKGREILEDSLAQSLEHKQYWVAGAVYANLSTAYLDVYELHRAEILVKAGLTFALEHDLDQTVNVMQSRQAILAFYQGQWAQADRATAALLQRTDLQAFALTPTLLCRGRLLIRRGEAGGSSLIEKALDSLLESDSRRRFGSAYAVQAEAAWLAEDLKLTLAEAKQVYAETIDHKHPGFATELAYWCWRAGETVEIFEWMLPAFALEIKGEWQAAADAWKAMGFPYEQARALADGDTAAQLEALAIFKQLGAHPMIDKVAQRLQKSGQTTIPRGPRPTTQANPFNLTNRQLEILTLLTQNLTNAEIAAQLSISAKTVDHHVSAVLAKLNVSTRAEAADIARQHPDF